MGDVGLFASTLAVGRAHKHLKETVILIISSISRDWHPESLGMGTVTRVCFRILYYMYMCVRTYGTAGVGTIISTLEINYDMHTLCGFYNLAAVIV